MIEYRYAIYLQLFNSKNVNHVHEQNVNYVPSLYKDSSFYHDGEWEVMETDNGARSIRSKTSHGVETIAEYDDTWHINKFYLVNKTDTVTKEQYFWKNGKLIKTKINGLERIFIYGKTLQDTVKVIPSDEYLYFHSGYNNSVGKIPDKNDPMYEYFTRDPYSGIYASDNEKNRLFLGKLNSYQFPKMDYSIPEPAFMNPNRNNCKAAVCPPLNYPNGHISMAGLFLNENGMNARASCVMDSNNCYKINYKIKVNVTEFEIVQSILKHRLLEPKWDRYCRTEYELQDTYNHERQHFLNANKYAKEYVNNHLPSKNFSTKNECEASKKEAEDIIFNLFIDWLRRERDHSNSDSPPKYSFPRVGEICDID